MKNFEIEIQREHGPALLDEGASLISAGKCCRAAKDVVEQGINYVEKGKNEI